MIETQILEAIKKMPNVDRLKIIEFTLRLVREEMEKTEKLSLKDAAEIMRPYYAEGSNLTEFVDLDQGDFYEYQDYA
ncbi:hypothetical protein [Planktothrix mougeotii]|uniref:DUF2281 domain-containing protein n=1 Tax=Planktothrix mougeotii LEGE 06226 TaxID=1828728 RepID=A0ABR9UK69_9CYAN|nr:hypothetical protein [Planktothrix mougeotii]MBE9146539.1 hypothetical protein [Planktothrix mougeotii LEGE 06226]